MSERLTTVHLPGVPGTGLEEYGRKTAAEMIAAIRRYAEARKQEAEAILAASDADFHVYTHLGIYAKREIEIIQRGRKP